MLRERVDLTVRQVAAEVGVQGAHSTIGDWFAGRGLPSISSQDLLIRVLAVCGVREDAFIEQWLRAWRRVRRSPGRRAGGHEPYRGLSCFQPDDAKWFCGRARLVADLVARLGALRDHGGGVQVVVGASGSGKSSILRAGLIPAVRDGALGSSDWSIVLFTPGDSPVRALADSLAAAGKATAAEVDAAIRADPAATGSVISTLSLRAPDVLVIVDQFEEAFTTCTDEGERHKFVTALCSAADQAKAIVVLGVRADFYAPLLDDPRLLAAVQAAQLTVGPMNPSELREAIAEPARKAKVDLEDGLVDLLLHEVSPRSIGSGAHEVGVLPLLSHALYATWQHGQGRRMTISSYHEVGGIAGAVAATADRVYGQLSDQQRKLARRLFLSLVHLADDTADTRRRVTTAELLSQYGGDGAAQLEDVLDQFVANRLITADVETVEISHEALLTAWPTLREWLNTNRAEVVVGRQLATDAAVWQRADRDPALLYRGTRLAAAQSWLGHHHDDVPPSALEFVEGSALHARRRTRRLHQLIAFLTVLTLLTVGLAGYAFQQRSEANAQGREAVHQRNQAISRLVAARAEEQRASDVSLARQLNLAAYRISPTVEARSSLLDSYTTPASARLLGFASAAQSVAYSPDRRTLAAASLDYTVRLWDSSEPAKTPVPIGRPLTGATQGLFTVAFSPDGRRLAAAGGDALVYLWDVSDPYRPLPWPRPLRGPTSTIYSLVFSPDGRHLLAGSADKHVWVWRMAATDDVHALPPLSGPTNAVQSVAISPDGGILAAGDANHRIWLWDITDPARPAPLARSFGGHTHKVFAVAFSPDGRTLASGSGDKTIRLWDLTNPRRPRARAAALTGHTSWINSLMFSTDGRSLTVGSSDKTVTIWDLTTSSVTTRLPHPAPVTAISYGRDNHTIASTGTDGVVRVWNLPGPTLSGHTDAVFNLTYSADGRTLVSASRDQTVRRWTVADPRSPVRLEPTLTSRVPGHPFTGTTALSPDGSTLAVGTRTGQVHLWDVTNPDDPTWLDPPLTGPTDLIETISFSPDGKMLAAGGDDTNIYLWRMDDVRRPSRLATIVGAGALIFSLIFSPDGRMLASASSDGTAKLWNLANPAAPTPIGPPITDSSKYAYGIAFTPDGRTIAVGGADRTVRLWDINDPARPAPASPPLIGPGSTIYWVTFSPDGHTLAAAVTDGTVWIWDTANRHRPTLMATLNAATAGVFVVAYSPDGRILAGAGADTAIRLWKPDAEEVTKWICATSGDPITTEEWQQYVPDLPFEPPCPKP